MATLAKSMPQSVRFRASLLGAHATAKAFEFTDWLAALMQTLESNRHFLKEQLDAKLPKAKYRIPDCSYLAWIDLSDYQLGASASQVVLELGKLAFPRVKSSVTIATNSYDLTLLPAKK